MLGFWRWKQRETVGNYDDEMSGYIDIEGCDKVVEDWDDCEETIDEFEDEEE